VFRIKNSYIVVFGKN